MLLQSFERVNASAMPVGSILNLSGAQKYEEDVVFPAGRYKVECSAAGTFRGIVDTEVMIKQPFKIMAYSGSTAIYDAATETITAYGKNPYQGPFKVNGQPAAQYGQNVPYVSHIFGNAGSCCRYTSGSGSNQVYKYSSGGGNCLSDGNESFGAGSCIHFLPVGGVFGTDYLFAAHCCSSGWFGGPGSARGGAASGYSTNGDKYKYNPSPSYNGGSTPYGTGGAGVPASVQSDRYEQGKPGTGIGAARTVLMKDWLDLFYEQTFVGASCFYKDGEWKDGTYDDTRFLSIDGYIRVTYLGPL